jgi:two-component system phosphate regulon sensor histidine kinase PhoR
MATTPSFTYIVSLATGTEVGLLAALIALALPLAALIRKALKQRAENAALAAALDTLQAAAIPGAPLPCPADPARFTGYIQQITVELQRQRADLELELNGLKAILESMTEGLLVVDSEKRVLMANAAARTMLNLPEGDILNKPLREIARHPDLLGNLDLSLSAAQTCSFEFQPATTPNPPKDGGKGRTHILVRCAPFKDASRTMRGAIAVLHDISELRRLERVRTEFVANVSHELRTPLTSLMGYLETLHEDDWSDLDQSRKFLLVCRRQAERLSRIVEDLLRLSRLENPQQEIAAAEVNLCEVVSAAIDQCRPLAEERAITLEMALPPQRAVICGDRGLLVQAVSNLVENAIHYNKERGRVAVRLGRHGAENAQWQIAVSDTGIGIPPEAAGRIFERFYRVDKARSRDKGGTGLGLSIVRHIALAHGASVHVESKMEQGSTFFLRFRRQEFEPKPAPEARG